MNRIRTAWSTISASPKRIAATVGVVAGALIVGLGFSLGVDAIRGDQNVGQRPSVAASPTGQPSSAPVTASPWPTTSAVADPTPSATATASASPRPSPSATVPAPRPSPPPTPSATPSSTPTPGVGGDCDEVMVDELGAVYVKGELVEDPWSSEYGEQMPMAVLRLGARAAASTLDAEVCLEVELPGVIVTGVVELCGEVIADGQPTIAGVEIPDRMLDVNSYPLLDIADVEDVPACLHVQADANDVHVTLSMAICQPARLGSGGELTILAGDRAWTFAPEYVYDDDGALVMGEIVDVGLDIRNYKDDVIHLVEMAVWVTPGCP